MKFTFIIVYKRNDVVVVFGTFKVQSFILTKVSDCGLLIVSHLQLFSKEKTWQKKHSQLSRGQIIKNRSPAHK